MAVIEKVDAAPAATKPRVRVRAGRGAPLAMTPYQGASSESQSLRLWQTRLASADADALPARGDLVSRARDLVRNDALAAAAVNRLAERIVGNSWRLASKPNARALGISPEAARELGREMESVWEEWAEDPRKFCDRTRRQTFAGMMTSLAKSLVGADGEAFGVLGFKRDAKRPLATTFEVIDPDRISTPIGRVDDELMRAGVELDDDGAPIAAHVRKGNWRGGLYASSALVWERVPWETATGRPIVIHVMDPDRAGQTRGVSRLAAIIEPLRQLTLLTTAELNNAVLNALFGAFVETSGDPKAIAEAIGDGENDAWGERVDFYSENPVVMNGVRVPVLAPGDTVKLNATPRPTADFVKFRNAFVGVIASQLGLSFEQVAMDWSQTNYSSARAALNEVWCGIKARRALLAQHAATPIFMAVMEEAFLRGAIVEPAGAPRFMDRPAAYCRCLWIGPARGWVDPVKERQAVQIGLDVGVSTLEIECAEQGLDWEEVLEQRRYESEAQTAAGLALSPDRMAHLVPAPEDEPQEPLESGARAA